MTLLRATDVRFVRAGEELVRPLSFSLGAGETLVLEEATPFAASLAARLCAAVVKPTAGTIFACEYETRLQAPHAKRRIGFVDARGFAGDAHAFACEIAFHAEIWGVRPELARARARDVLAGLGREDAYARAIALALATEIDVVVLDQPELAFVAPVRALVPRAALVRTHVTGDRTAPNGAA